MEEIGFRDLGIGDMGWLIQRHAELYAQAEGFDASFEPLVAQILLDHVAGRDPACERAWIAHAGERRLGSIFCVKGAAPGEAKLRLFFVEPEARGRGLGARLLRLCLDYARARGYARMTLWTHESHRAACALYAGYGFRMVSTTPVRNFGCDLVEQGWEIDLAR
ncbi:GNAT superfamily N-acetyltransferase [Rhodovulum iodosum]|uniref:GNAT superfamily N-acetyltransferase n=1 Tax=Rhodovulum iodosum TaxID=68291 RepID=A0ABV3XNU3_9RHOB|nr:GNAT family N-acetyltransferase [Rhodovulum robiginosum]RSK34780.1 GNAT family N-acetyltransferase [Rhodovulum robiginosum]